MNINLITRNGVKVAVVESDEVVITDAQSALQLAASIIYESDCYCIAIPKSCVAQELFVLSTGLAGEVLQKFVNFHCKLAIFGDYSCYTSKSLHDFIYESNKNGNILFVSTQGEAVSRLTGGSE